MKKITCWILGLSFIFTPYSCKKDDSEAGLSSVHIIHASVNSPTFLLYLSIPPSAYSQNQAQLSFGSSLEYGTPAGSNSFSIVSSSDTTKPVLQTTLMLKPGGLYSLYLAGQGLGVEALLLQDTIPVHTDSSAGVRFINLSPSSQPVTVNLVGAPLGQNDFSSLDYKQISSFKTYPCTNGIFEYDFEIRDKTSGDLLATFNWNFTLFKNNTLVIGGLPNNMGVFSVNNF